MIDTLKYSLWVVQICPNKSKMADGRHLEKSTNLNIFATDWPILTKFGTVMRLGLPDTSANKILRNDQRMRDIAIFRIFNMAAAAVLDFWNREILLCED